MTRTQKNRLYAVLAAAVIILDRITKAYAITHFMQPKYITNFLTFELTYNRGISWGMFNSASDTVFLMVTFVIGCVTAMVAHMAWQRYKEGQWVIGELLVVAGSVSNIIDRVLYRGVVDFILFHWNGWSWPLFNIADMAIVVGVSIMIWEQLKS